MVEHPFRSVGQWMNQGHSDATPAEGACRVQPDRLAYNRRRVLNIVSFGSGLIQRVLIMDRVIDLRFAEGLWQPAFGTAKFQSTIAIRKYAIRQNPGCQRWPQPRRPEATPE
jgi:hypothetical protein